MVSPIGLVEEEQKGGLTTKWLFFTFRKGKDCTLAKFQSHKQETKIYKRELWMTSLKASSGNNSLIPVTQLLKISTSLIDPNF